jgi:hypothetical protein
LLSIYHKNLLLWEAAAVNFFIRLCWWSLRLCFWVHHTHNINHRQPQNTLSPGIVSSCATTLAVRKRMIVVICVESSHALFIQRQRSYA